MDCVKPICKRDEEGVVDIRECSYFNEQKSNIKIQGLFWEVQRRGYDVREI